MDMQVLPEHLRHILDLARWAPSGDNTQPWRFEVLGDEHVLVHGFDTRDHVVYDLDGHASQLAHGALLETMAIAASTRGRQAQVLRRPDTPETHPLYDVRFQAGAGLEIDPLAAHIENRMVQRRAMSTRALSDDQKSALAAALPQGYQVIWFEGLAKRWRLARFMFDNAKVRLIMPEAYEVHRQVIEWGARYSEDRIPEQAVGVDPMTARLMRWAMASWKRVDFLNTWLMGTLAPRIQLDLLPGLRCAAHFALVAKDAVSTIDDYVSAGRAMQRFWLGATALGLRAQPEMTPVIFTRYARDGRAFTGNARVARLVEALNTQLCAILDPAAVTGVFFMGRLGFGATPRSRSTRKAVEKLMFASGRADSAGTVE